MSVRGVFILLLELVLLPRVGVWIVVLIAGVHLTSVAVSFINVRKSICIYLAAGRLSWQSVLFGVCVAALITARIFLRGPERAQFLWGRTDQAADPGGVRRRLRGVDPVECDVPVSDGLPAR